MMLTRSHFVIAGMGVLSAVVLITFRAASMLNFYGDDYSFLEIAGRSSLAQYLAFYFDPRLQTGWYRPMQGMLFGIEWILFGGNPVGYHLVNVAVHLANVWLLFALVQTISQKPRGAFLSALIYAGLPPYGVAVFWPGDADFLLTFFYLNSILGWVLYLQRRSRRFFVWSFGCFLLALMTKEFGVLLPVMLFLVDRLLFPDKVSLSALTRRYAPLAFVYLIYLPLEIYIQSHSVLTNMYGYRVADHVISNLVQYLAALAMPWGLPEPVNYIWLVVAVWLYGFITLKKKSAALLFLGIAPVLAFLPVTPFPWFFTRYLYLALMATAIVIAALADFVVTRLPRARWLAAGVFALITLGNSLGIANATADFAELGRQTRVPFRDISQRHPTFPDDTYLYFIDPPTITAQLSGMFFLRYGAGVRVASDEYANRRANLRAHQNSIVVYFDDQRRTRELPVEQNASVTLRPALPIDFAAPMQLEDFELARANIARDQAIALVLYWRALKPLESDYTVVAQMVDLSGKVVAESEQTPRHGQASTSGWSPGALVVDAIVLSVSSVAPGNYRLEIALYDPATQQRVALVDARGNVIAERIVIESVRVVE